MSLILALFLSFGCLLFSTIQGYFIAYPLLLSLLLFILLFRAQGFHLKPLLQMAFSGSRKAFPVIYILLLVGAVTASWMAAGTTPALVYYGIQLIHPKGFILAAFVLTSFVSLLIGTSFGAVSTIGVALMVMSSSSQVSPHLIAGAIIAGAYVGDRCSPMSSSAHLIAIVTQTSLYTNIRRMWRTAWLPLLLSIVLYGVLSLLYPVQMSNPQFLTELRTVFQINIVVLLPALTILLLALCQVEVKRSMLLSVSVAVVIALVIQHYSPVQVTRFILLGFALDESSPLQRIFRDGGMLAMLRVCGVVMISTAFVGLFAGTRSLERLETVSTLARTRCDRFLNTSLIGLGAAAFGCTQTIAILLTQQLVEPQYRAIEQGQDQLALDLENTVVVLAPLIPWNIAGLVPATILGVNAGFIPFALFLYLVPLLNWRYRFHH